MKDETRKDCMMLYSKRLTLMEKKKKLIGEIEYMKKEIAVLEKDLEQIDAEIGGKL